ncbi:MAG: Gfo/Idh/MocA family protein [Candidatus Zipacnadales bacterium]
MSHITRRDFIHKFTKAVAGASVGLTIIKARKSAFAQNEQIGVAVMGINGRGQSHIDAYCAIDGVRVVALIDPDSRLFESRAKKVVDKQGGDPPKCYTDIREALQDDAIDVVSIATCNHWHALGTVWACQAKRDVYVEKPASWSVWEGRKMVEAAEKYGRIVQVGCQSRSSGQVRNAIARIRAGQIGEVYMARALCYKPRASIGFKEPSDPPAGLDFNLWLGPAPQQPYHANLVHYNWHWFWDFGNGDLGNQGVHQMDIALWGLDKALPVKVFATGGRFGYHDQGETPNTQICTFEYEDGKQLVFEVRGHYTNGEAGVLQNNEISEVRIGNLFYGSEGWIASSDGYKAHMGHEGKSPTEAPLDLPEVGGSGQGNHFQNFIDAVRSRKPEDLNAPIIVGHYSSALCHLANISYRLGRSLTFDPVKEQFVNDREANKLLKREYRQPFVLPENV